MTTDDLYQSVTDKLVTLIEAGTLPWRRDWSQQSGGSGLPMNPFTGRYYAGINVVLLWAEAQEKGYADNRWATFRQVAAAGGHVRRGEKGTRIVFYRTLDVEDEEAEDGVRRVPVAKSFTVFNTAAQCEGLPAAEPPSAPPAGPELDERLEAFVANVGADIRFNAGRAFYSPGGDYIGMPRRELFQTTAGFYATLLHELCHLSGHPKRLDRLKLCERFGSESYAAEELVAELGSSFLCAEFAIPSDLPNHASYLASWLKILKDDKRAIFRAAAAASRAAQFLKDCQPKAADGAASSSNHDAAREPFSHDASFPLEAHP